MIRRLALAALLASLACGADDDPRPARWSYISAAIIRPNCATASCHSRAAATGGLQLEEAEGSWVVLTGYSAAGNFVVPGAPDRSRLLYLLRGRETKRMPPDQPLPDADIDLIERWILAGAHDD
jgi:cytochrome c